MSKFHSKRNTKWIVLFYIFYITILFFFIFTVIISCYLIFDCFFMPICFFNLPTSKRCCIVGINWIENWCGLDDWMESQKQPSSHWWWKESFESSVLGVGPFGRRLCYPCLVYLSDSNKNDLAHSRFCVCWVIMGPNMGAPQHTHQCFKLWVMNSHTLSVFRH